MSQKGLAPILIVIIIAILIGGYFIYQNQAKPAPPPQQTTQPSPTPVTTSTQPVAQPPAQNGADLENIKYTLPSGWKTEITNDSLTGRSLRISPKTGSGLLVIHTYNYPNNIGRREYYCKVTNFCIEGTTYYTQMQIGNISGYEAQALDNSGGGSEYFGAKGNKFYILSKIRDITSETDEFNTHLREVLNSLVF